MSLYDTNNRTKRVNISYLSLILDLQPLGGRTHLTLDVFPFTNMLGGNTFNTPNPATVQLPTVHLLSIALEAVAMDDSWASDFFFYCHTVHVKSFYFVSQNWHYLIA